MKKKLMAIITVMALCLSLAACGNSSTPASGQQSDQGTAQSTETTGPAENDYSSQVQENSSQLQEEEKNKVAYFGDTLITGVLNDSETAKALIEKLPMTQHMSRYSHDFCGVTEELPYNEDDVHYGWLNGDIDYALNAPYFTILFEDEDVSEQYGYQVNIGVITCPIADIAALQGSYDVRIELAD